MQARDFSSHLVCFGFYRIFIVRKLYITVLTVLGTWGKVSAIGRYTLFDVFQIYLKRRVSNIIIYYTLLFNEGSKIVYVIFPFCHLVYVSICV